MKWWYNLPFFMIWTPLILSSVTAIVKPGMARKMIFIIPGAEIFASVILLYQTIVTDSSFTYSLGEFGAPFGNELRAGKVEALMALVFGVVMLISVLGGYKRLLAHVGERRQSLYCVMVLLLTAALMAEVFTNDLFTGYVFIEIMTIAAGALIAVRNRGRSLFASTKYMIMNMLGSGLFLMGMSMIYCMTGELLMSSIHGRVAELVSTGSNQTALIVSIALMAVGIAVKSALYPFHAWLPDAYSMSTPASSAMLSSLVSKAYIFLFIKIIVRVIGLDIMRKTHINTVLMLYAMVGIIMGSVDAILERKLRRMIAYSSVAQIGYIYLGIAVGTKAGVAAAILHIIAHAVAKSLLFISGDKLIGASDGDASFLALRGSGYRAPLSGIAFTAGSCSIVGIPLLAGFASKLYLAQSCLGMSGTKAILALIVLAVSTALNAAYFLITIITLYDKPLQVYKEGKTEQSVMCAIAMIAAVFLLLALGVCGSGIHTLIMDGVTQMV